MTKFEPLEISKLATVSGGAMPNFSSASTLTNGPARFGAKIGAAMASGKFDYNRMVDNGNRYGGAGIILGGGAGGLIGAPGGPPGIATGAAIGGTAGGVAGFLGGAAYDANQQANEINAGRR